MNELKIFENPEFGQLRMVFVDGRQYFVANDVAKALGYSVPKDAVTRHCKGATFQRYLTEGGEQAIKVIPEGDVYRLIIRSKLPKAEEFEHWVFDEVLPSIHRYGIYATDSVLESILTSPDFGIRLLSELKEEREARRQAEKTVEEMTPKAIFADAVSVSKTSILIGELAKLLKQNGVEMGEKRLFEWLRNNGYLIKRGGADRNTPTQKSMELKLFEVKETPVIHSNGNVTVSKTTKVTGKGQQYFINKFLMKKAVQEKGCQ